MVHIGELRMWGDEAYGIYSANRTLTAITFEGAENDPHPPLYYYLLHFYMPLAGASELSVRFFSVFPGVATVALLYLIGKRLFNPRVGLMAAAFAAIAPFDIYYSQEIRMYALAIFLTTLATYFFARLMQEGATQVAATTAPSRPSPTTADGGRLCVFVAAVSNRPLWFAYALAMLLALYTLYHTALVLLAQGIFVLTLWRTRRNFVLRWFGVSFGVVVLFLPWLLVRLSSTLGHLEDRAGQNIQSLPMFVARGFAALTVGATIPPTNALVLAAVFGALLIVGLIVAFKTRQAKANDGLILALALVPLVAVYPLYLLLPIFVARLFALAFTPLALVLARSISLLDRRAAVPFALAIGAIAAYSLNDYYFRFDRYNASAEDYMPVIRAVEQNAQPGDFVLIHANWQTGYFLSHYQGPPVQYGELTNRADLDRAVAQPRNIWAVVQGFALHGSEVWLAQQAFPIGEQKFGQMRLSSYRAGTPESGNAFATPVVFNNGIALLGYRYNREPLESGRGVVTIQLDWQATRKIAGDYTVSVRLANLPNAPRGPMTWAQEDSQPASGTMPTSEWETNQIVQDRHAFKIPVGTPRGEYAIKVVMYESKSGTPATIVAPENLRGQAIETGNIAVVKPAIIPPSPPIPNALDAEWDGIALAGFESGAEELKPGDALPLTLYWQAFQKPGGDYRAVIQMIDSSGKAHAPVFYRPSNEVFPTSGWNAGETWLDKIQFKIDADTAPGDATVLIGLIGEYSGNEIPLKTRAPLRRVQIENPVQNKPMSLSTLELTRVRITAREHRFDLPSLKHPLQANFDNKIKLLGYDLDEKNLKLVLYWQALGAMDERYTVFVHLLDASGALVAQKDSEPDSGNAPTTSWLPNEIIADRYEMKLPDKLEPGEYTLEIGLYQAATGKRLAVLDTNSDHIELTRVSVTPR